MSYNNSYLSSTTSLKGWTCGSCGQFVLFKQFHGCSINNTGASPRSIIKTCPHCGGLLQ